MSRNTRTLIVLLVAVATAALASFGVYRAVQSIPVREVEVARAQVVVAAKPLAIGTMLTKDDVKLVPWPAANIIPGSLTTIEAAVNRGLISPAGENEPLTESKLAAVGAGAGLPPTITPGMRAISVKVNEVIGVAGFVVPGTRVDVLVSIRDNNTAQTRVVLSNVQVLTAGTRYDQESARAEGKPIPTSVVTLLVTPSDAEKLTLASEEGRIMLTLRNPLDTEPSDTTGVGRAALLGAPAPPPVQKVVNGRPRMVTPRPAPAPPEAQRRYTVETIRAAKRAEEEVR